MPVLPQSAKEIVETGMADETSLQRQTISLFCGLLGKFGGDLALTLVRVAGSTWRGRGAGTAGFSAAVAVPDPVRGQGPDAEI